MLLLDRDPNGGGGRTSRASNVSGMSGASGNLQIKRSRPNEPLPAGVNSMLRTSTDTDMSNVGGRMGSTSAMGHMPRGQQRGGASSRLSTTSSMSNQSGQAGRGRQQHPSASASRHTTPRPHLMPQYANDTLSPTPMHVSGSSPLVPMQGTYPESSRSRSMTHNTSRPGLSSNSRSFNGLRHDQPTHSNTPSQVSLPRSTSQAMSDVVRSRASFGSDNVGPGPGYQAQFHGYQAHASGSRGQSYSAQAHSHSDQGLHHGNQGQLYSNPGETYDTRARQHGNRAQPYTNPSPSINGYAQPYSDQGLHHGNQGQLYSSPAQSYNVQLQQYYAQSSQYTAQGHRGHAQGYQYNSQEPQYNIQGLDQRGGHPPNGNRGNLRESSTPPEMTSTQRSGLPRMRPANASQRSSRKRYRPNVPSNIPPVPAIPEKFRNQSASSVAGQRSRSVRTSSSSGSTDRRNGSDTPSSHVGRPPAAGHNTSMAAAPSLNGTSSSNGTMSSNGVAVITEEPRAGLRHYNHTERLPPNSVMSTIVEEQVQREPTTRRPTMGGLVVCGVAVPTGAPTLAELPASPVVNRITRTMIRNAVDPSSTIGDVETSTSPHPSNGGHSSDSELPSMQHVSSRVPVPTSLRTEEDNRRRHSILSQTGSSVLDSSTLDFAVHCTIPTLGAETGPTVGSLPSSDLPVGPEEKTEDGMSELLAGYQDTDTKRGSDLVSRIKNGPKKIMSFLGDEALSEPDLKPLPLTTRSRSNHVPKSSDDVSFKSCTDLPEVALRTPSDKPNKDRNTKSFASTVDVLLEQESAAKESDARSFATAQLAASPDRAASMPPTRLPSSSLGSLVLHRSRPVSEMPSSKPPATVLRKALPNSRPASSFSLMANKLRSSSKPSIKHGSVSASGSTSTLSAFQLPPVVPPRESSSSREAQRVKAAVSSLIRSRFAKERKNVENAEEPKLGEMKQFGEDSTQDAHDASESCEAVVLAQETSEFDKVPDEMYTRPNSSRPRKMASAELRPMQDCNPIRSLDTDATFGTHKRSVSSPIVVQEPSSVYSPQDNSLRSRARSSPSGVPVSPVYNRRDSQTTTHLEWHPRLPPLPSSGPPVPCHTSSTSGAVVQSLSPLSNIQEDTTTNLQLDGHGYGYARPSRYLPDLKEESHEDSSLNTSASNLKHSNFRFPFVASSGGRPASVNDKRISSRRSSMASHRRSAVGSALELARGLPSMQFSRMNLIEGLDEGFGLRYSRSMNDLTRVPRVSSEDSPPRPASACEVQALRRISGASLEVLGQSRESTHPVTAMSLFGTYRVRSPGLMAELDRVRIPSLEALTLRLSELLPSFRQHQECGEQCEFPEEEEIEKHALEKIHEVHPTQKRSSARLRPLRGASHMVVIEDDLYEELTGKDKENESVDRQGDGGVENGASGVDSVAKSSGRSNNVTVTQTPPKLDVVELQAPAPATLRPRSQTIDNHHARASIESSLSSRRSLRSFISTPTTAETRPWNWDKNYPWATATKPSIDISLPPPAVSQQSPYPGPSNLRNRLSDASTASSFSTAQTATISGFGSAGEGSSNARQHRFSTFGRNGNQSHGAGERYPTTALELPTQIFRDNLIASDTDDEEDYRTTRKTRVSLKKRFSSTRNATRDQNARAVRSKVNPQDLASPESIKQSTTSLVQDSAGEAQAFTTTANRHTFRDAEGMRPADYHKHRVIEQLRKWWHKGGNLIRTLSGRRRTNSTTA